MKGPVGDDDAGLQREPSVAEIEEAHKQEKALMRTLVNSASIDGLRATGAHIDVWAIK